MNLAHRTIHNAVFNVASWAVPMVIGFLFTPFIVRTLQADAYGILTLVWSVIGYLTFLDLGLGQAVTKFVAEHNGRDDPEAVNHSIGAAILVSAVLGTAGGIAIFVLSGPLAGSWLKVPPDMVGTARTAFRIGAWGFVFGMFHTMCRAMIRGLSRYDIASSVSIVSSALTTLGSALMLRLGATLLHVVMLNVFVPLAASCVFAAAARRVRPGLRISLRTTRPAFRQMLRFGAFSTLSRVAYTALSYFDSILIAAVLGMSAVTYYTVPFRLVGRLSRVTLQVANVIFPAVSELQGQRRQETLAQLYLTSSRIMMALSTAVCVPLIAFGDHLLALWMGPDFAASAGHVMLFAAIGTYVDSLTNIPSFTVDGMGRPDITGISSLAIAGLTLGLMVPFAHRWGINGVAFASVIGSAAVMPVFTWYATRYVVGMPVTRLLTESLARPLGLGLLFLAGLELVPIEQIESLLLLLAVIGASGLAYLGLAAMTGVFQSRERRAVAGYLRLMQAKFIR